MIKKEVVGRGLGYLLLVTSLTACGQKGPLYIPKEPPAVAKVDQKKAKMAEKPPAPTEEEGPALPSEKPSLESPNVITPSRW